jgi:MYXO-CTERM domain-containing protein
MTRNPILGEHAETLGLEGLQDFQGGEYDLFVGEFSIDAGYDFLSYLGGSGPEDSYFPYTSLMAMDAAGATYLVGTSASDDFPTTSHPFQKQRHGAADIDNMVVVKIMPTPPQATITSVTPSEGPTSGISVDVDGTNMSCACEVDFGGTPAQVQCQGAQSGQLDVITPPHACGTFDVTLSCPGSPPSVLPDGFTFVGCPDAGPPDAGPVSDAGHPENASSGSSCGCGSTGSPLAASCALGLVLLAMVPRRRQRRNP